MKQLTIMNLLLAWIDETKVLWTKFNQINTEIIAVFNLKEKQKYDGKKLYALYDTYTKSPYIWK